MTDPSPVAQKMVAAIKHREAEKAVAAAAALQPRETAAVRAAVAPIVARRPWVLGFLAVLGLNVAYDLVARPVWLWGFDAVMVIAALALFRALESFRAAATSGSVGDLEEGLSRMMRYVRINTVMGWLGLLALVLFVVAAAVLVSQGMHSWRH